MSSVVDICNIALSHVGADSQVSSIMPPDGTVEAGYCARFYPIARRQLLEAHAWTFAKVRTALAEVANASAVWAYAYQRPADCVRVLRVLRPGIEVYPWCDEQQPVHDRVGLERGSADFEVEGNVIRTNEPEAVLVYLRDVEDTTRFTPGFEAALGVLLASYLAGPLVKGLTGARLAGVLQAQAVGQDGRGGMAGKAAALDASNSSAGVEHTPGHIMARN